MKIKFFSFFVILALTACGDPLYKGGGFGGLAGDGNSIITISGYVMSTATFQSTSAQLAGLEGESAFTSSFSAMMSEYDDPSMLIGGVENVADACAGAQWSMTFVGSGGASAGSGYAAGDGSFDVPSIPQGKEAVINFNCSGMAQKCLVKAGDTGITCNAIADGVVGALEASIGKDLTDTSLSGKTIAKVATSIVESAKSESTDSDSLKQAILICKDMPMNTIAQMQAKKDCYKGSLDASSMSGTLEIAKGLTQQWTVRNLFNFMTTTAGHDIYIDSLTYTPFGAKLDEWLDTDFISQTKAYISDIVTNPDYVNGVIANGDQVVKIECVMDYHKQQNGGKYRFRPTIVGGIPSCNNISELESITGVTINTDPNATMSLGKLLNDFSLAIAAGNNNHQAYQVGSIFSGAPSPCFGGSVPPESFCLNLPELVITSKVKEPNRNDTSGESMGGQEYDFRTNLIDVFDEVMGQINTLYLDTAYTGHPKHVCMATTSTFMIDSTTSCSSWAANNGQTSNPQPLTTCFTHPSSPFPHHEINISTLACNTWVKNFMQSSDPNKNCIMFPEGAPPFNLNSTYEENAQTKSCSTWAGTQIAPLRNNFAGIMGLYLYLKNPTSYANGGAIKLSLQDLHLIFTKSDFFNVKMAGFSSGFNWKNFSGNGQMYPPIVDFVTGPNARLQAIFQNSNTEQLTQGDIEKGSLENHYDLTFSMFQNIPTSQDIRSYVDYSSHHQEWNPFGAKYFYVPAISISSTLYPIYCKMVNRDKNNIPMQKELNPSTKIICNSNPSTGVTAGTGASVGTFTYSSSFDYPYILQMRGFNGDGKGKIFALADRGSGDTIKVAGREIYLLEAHSRNSNSTQPAIYVSGNTCLPNPDETGAAPLTRIKLNYGFGNSTKQDIVDAYCLSNSFFPSDTNATPYNGGSVSFTMTEANGNSHMESWQKAGGKNSSGQIGEYCFFTASTTFNDSSTGWTSSMPVANYSTTSATNTFGTYNYNKVLSLTTNDAVDLCSSTTQSGKVKYYLTHYFDGNNYNATSPMSRGNMPLGLFSVTANKPVFGWAIALSAIENKASAMSLTFANSGSTSKFQNLKMVNAKHNPKFDPFCDDDDNNGACDCFVGNTNTPRTNPDECNLYDSTAELTFSKRVFDPMVTSQMSFMINFKNKSGSELVQPSTSIGLSQMYLNNTHPGLMLDDIFTCKFVASGETLRRKPSNINWSDLSASNHPGCPLTSGATATSGPIRVVNPRPMKNAYDIGKPKTVMNLINYATKTVGQGVYIDRYAKVLTFDEALALIILRIYLPPQELDVYNPSGTFKLQEASSKFFPVRSSFKDTSAVTEIVRGITKPTLLNQ